MSLSIKMPTLADFPDYQCHCVIQHGPGPELEYCFAKSRAAMLKREAAWAEQAEQYAHRVAYWTETIGKYVMGYDGIHCYEGEVLDYDPDTDRYQLDQNDCLPWIDGKTLTFIPDPR